LQVTQAAAGPGLGRISHRQPSNDYLFSDAADGCSGMTAYIIDTVSPPAAFPWPRRIF